MTLRKFLEETKVKWNPLFVIYSYTLGRNASGIGFDENVTVIDYLEWNTENLHQWKEENRKGIKEKYYPMLSADMEKYTEWLTKKYERAGA